MTTAASTVSYKVLMTDGTPQLAVNNTSASPQLACEYLERGGVIFFPETPFKISSQDRQFLLTQKQQNADYHKNIAYRPSEDRVTGFTATSPEAAEQLRRILKDYHNQTRDFLRDFLAPYSRNWKPDFASFRPIEEKGRKMRLRARNDLLHVDSFATRPIFGDRILRVFININPSQVRVWNTSDTFEKLAETYKDRMSPPVQCSLSALSQIEPLKTISRLLGFRSNSGSAYDSWMLNFHNFLKENSEFQSGCRKDRWEFPPNSSWIVFTDMVSHAVLSGQYAMEQTYIISRDDLVLPQKAPINILKRLYPQNGLS